MNKETLSQELREELREKINAYLARKEDGYSINALARRTGISRAVLVNFIKRPDTCRIEPRQKQAIIEALKLDPAVVPDAVSLSRKVWMHISRKGEFTIEGLAAKAHVNRMTISQILNNDESLSNDSTIALVVKALGLPQDEEEYLLERLLGLRRRATEQNATVRAPREEKVDSGSLPLMPLSLQQKMSAMREQAALRSSQQVEEVHEEWWKH